MKILCDTNIWIEFYKGNHAISDELQRIQVENLAVSIVSIGELYFGARNRIELQKIKQHLTSVHQIVFDKQTTQIFFNIIRALRIKPPFEPARCNDCSECIAAYNPIVYIEPA